jgi:signal transduction histidine kinase/CheY-like chemotaxis protein
MPLNRRPPHVTEQPMPKRYTSLRVAIDNLLEGVQVIGFDWIYRYVNQTAARHGQSPVDALVGRGLTECYPGIDRTPLFEVLQRVMRTRIPERLINEFEQPSGDRQWFELWIEPVPEGICVLSLDITEQRKMSADLLRAQKLEEVGRLVSGVAHDFNNLLTAIIGYSAFVSESVEDPAIQADVGEIQKAAERAARLTRQLLRFTRKEPIAAEVISPAAVLSELRPMLERLLPGVSLEMTLHDFDARAQIDTGHFEQVILNLVVNARDAMPTGGRVHIEVSAVDVDERVSQQHGVSTGPYVLHSVADTGEGIPADVRNRIFDPFFTTKAPDAGTGIGLSTVQTIVRQSGGFVTVESEVGRGTRFLVYLPAVTGGPGTAGADSLQKHAQAGECVLVIEPDARVSRLIRKTLQGCGYNVLTASGSAEAEALLDAASPDLHLVITELVMPELPGPQLAQRLIGRFPQLKVLYVTGFAQPRALDASNDRARLDLLLKPFRPAELAARVRALLDRVP